MKAGGAEQVEPVQNIDGRKIPGVPNGLLAEMTESVRIRPDLESADHPDAGGVPLLSDRLI